MEQFEPACRRLHGVFQLRNGLVQRQQIDGGRPAEPGVDVRPELMLARFLARCQRRSSEEGKPKAVRVAPELAQSGLAGPLTQGRCFLRPEPALDQRAGIGEGLDSLAKDFDNAHCLLPIASYH